MTRPIPEQVSLYDAPEQQWLIEATQLVTNSRVVVDQLAQYPCSVDPNTKVICLRDGLTTEQLMHVLPRAALAIVMDDALDRTAVCPFPLYAVPDPPDDTY